MTRNSTMKMLFTKSLLNTLLVIKVCQSLTIYQSGISTHANVNQTRQLRFQPPGNMNIYQDQYQLMQEGKLSSPKKTNEQPVTNDGLKSDKLHNNKKCRKRGPSFINYNNKKRHLKSIKRASPLTNNENWKNHKFKARKQRNSRENHDNKLIEQNIEEIKNVNENENENSDQQSTKADTLKQPSTKTVRPTIETSHEIRYLHDIFLNYPKPHHVNYGHVELSPNLFEKRFESQKAANRYKGGIMWLDNTGGFAQHYWDLALGKL